MIEDGIVDAQPSLMMLPLDVLQEFPMRTSADSPGEVEAADGMRYRVKVDAHGKPIMASEWICTQLGEEVGIAGAKPMLLKMLDGTLAFGSRRLGGAAQHVETELLLRSPSSPNVNQPIAGLKRILSNIYAFDLFINNIDRHTQNYVSVQESGSHRLHAIDYSRALFWNWPFAGFPVQTENTMRVGKELRQLHGFDYVSAEGVLNQLGAIHRGVLENLINRMPISRLTEIQKKDFLNLWSGVARVERINSIKEGFKNGQLL